MNGNDMVKSIEENVGGRKRMIRIAIVEDDVAAAKRLNDYLKKFCEEDIGGGGMRGVLDRLLSKRDQLFNGVSSQLRPRIHGHRDAAYGRHGSGA
jgi:hypothetical protein